MARVNVEDSTGGKMDSDQGKSATTKQSGTASGSLQRQGRAGWGESWRSQGVPLAPPISALSPFDRSNAGPLAVIRRMNEEMDRMFGGFGFAPWPSGRGESWAFSPPIEVYEDKGKLTVRAELPGLSKDDLKVEVTDEGLVISGERRNEDEQRGEGFYRSERSYGRFHRVIPLPDGVKDVDAAEAKFENGVLEVSLPVPENRRRRQIPVQTIGSGGEAGTTGSKSKTR